jgi:hypothetical protein
VANDVVALHLNLKAGIFKVAVPEVVGYFKALSHNQLGEPEENYRLSLAGNADGTRNGAFSIDEAFCA